MANKFSMRSKQRADTERFALNVHKMRSIRNRPFFQIENNTTWLLIFDLFICVPILRKYIYIYIFGINILWKNRKLICFLFTVCLFLPSRLFFGLLESDWMGVSLLLKSLLFIEFWMECNNSWFSLSLSSSVYVYNISNLFGVFCCCSCSSFWWQNKRGFCNVVDVFCITENGIEIRF